MAEEGKRKSGWSAAVLVPLFWAMVAGLAIVAWSPLGEGLVDWAGGSPRRPDNTPDTRARGYELHNVTITDGQNSRNVLYRIDRKKGTTWELNQGTDPSGIMFLYWREIRESDKPADAKKDQP